MKQYDCQITLYSSRGSAPIYACGRRSTLGRLRSLLRFKCEFFMVSYGCITAFNDDCSIVRSWRYDNGKFEKVG